MTTPDIHTLIREEVERNAISRALQPAPTKRSKLDAMVRHPLFLTLIAFLLTTIIGGAFSAAMRQHEATLLAEHAALVEAKEKAAARRSEAFREENAAIASLNNFVALVYRRTVVADQMRLALQRNALGEASEHRRAYDQAHMDWNIGLPQNAQELRRLVAVTHEDMYTPNPYEAAAHNVIDQWFGLERACLFSAYDAAKGLENEATLTCAEPWAETTETASHNVRVCARAILAGISADIRAVARTRASGQPPPALDDPDHLALVCKAPV